jgi:hypothetical protein
MKAINAKIHMKIQPPFQIFFFSWFSDIRNDIRYKWNQYTKTYQYFNTWHFVKNIYNHICWHELMNNNVFYLLMFFNNEWILKHLATTTWFWTKCQKS